MPGDERKRSEDALFERLHDSLGEKGVDDAASLRKGLEEAGVDVEKALREGRALFAGFVRRQRLKDAREAFERAKTAVQEFRRSASESIQGARDELARALAGEASGERYKAYCRKLEDVSSEDIESLKDDAALLDFVNRLRRSEDTDEV